MCYRKHCRILIKAISQRIGTAMLNSAALLMRQPGGDYEFTKSLHLSSAAPPEYHAVETFCQVLGLLRSTPVNGSVCMEGNVEGCFHLPADLCSAEGKLCLHLCSTTLQRTLMGEFLVAQKQSGRRVSLLPAKANGCPPHWLHSLFISEDFWPIPA